MLNLSSAPLKIIYNGQNTQWHSQPSLSGGAKWKNLPDFCLFFKIFPLFPPIFPSFPNFSLFFPQIFPSLWQIFQSGEHSAPLTPLPMLLKIQSVSIFVDMLRKHKGAIINSKHCLGFVIAAVCFIPHSWYFTC